MKISYDKISRIYSYPFSKKDLQLILGKLDPKIQDLIRGVKLGCNQKTSQEGRIVQFANGYDIRINFCLINGNESRLLSTESNYIREIEYCGGVVDIVNKTISWSMNSAKTYFQYLILHEIGHIVYCEERLNGRMGNKSSREEENWCNTYARNMISRIAVN